ncbi:gephyrin-like molybdotransferase receptor GlpR [Streptomyces monticola]|uniref:Gephyrin-like molybdotransferase receptor GlpR n=1 Tax=Streptomyces monticola TaxID=2666263 RepID=A0ABW2JJ89_9ACTN
MSSSGLIYAVIVGAWAAYLVPMWLRRQDELNEARPTERFSTAIRLLSGRAGMERRYAKDLRARTEGEEPKADPDAATEALTGSVDVRAFAVSPDDGKQSEKPGEKPRRREPREQREPRAEQREPRHEPRPEPRPEPRADRRAERSDAEAAARARRLKVLARRRRTTVMLFLAFTLGAIVAAVGGLALLWAPAVPAVLLSAYIVHLRSQERRRYTYTMDRRRAEVAAQRLRERRPAGRRAVADDAGDEPADGGESGAVAAGLSSLAADRRALVEQTDHAEWVDQQRERERGAARGDSWEPVPVPLPTYVTAPVAPRATGGVDLGAPDAWSSARSSAAEPTAEQRKPKAAQEPKGTQEGEQARKAEAEAQQAPARRAAARRSRERGRTPLFDQYAEGERPRAANE